VFHSIIDNSHHAVIKGHIINNFCFDINEIHTITEYSKYIYSHRSILNGKCCIADSRDKLQQHYTRNSKTWYRNEYILTTVKVANCSTLDMIFVNALLGAALNRSVALKYTASVYAALAYILKALDEPGNQVYT
jgi:hypothetical protein